MIKSRGRAGDEGIYTLPVFSAPALDVPVFAVISLAWAAGEFLRPARPLPTTPPHFGLPGRCDRRNLSPLFN
jgi:hypothetical protein